MLQTNNQGVILHAVCIFFKYFVIFETKVGLINRTKRTKLTLVREAIYRSNLWTILDSKWPSTKIFLFLINMNTILTAMSLSRLG